MPARPGPKRTGHAKRSRALFALAVSRADVRAQRVSPRAFRTDRGAYLDLAVDQDRRTARGLRLLSQSAQYETGIKAEKLMEVEKVLAEARAAKASGASRFCMARPGARPRSAISTRSAPWLRGVKALGPGDSAPRSACSRPSRPAAESVRPRLLQPQPRYRRNSTAPSSPRARIRIASTRSINVRDAGIHVCCGGKSSAWVRAEDRVGMIATWPFCRCIRRAFPINMLVQEEARRWLRSRSSNPLDFVAPLRWRASACRPRWFGSRPDVKT